MLQNTNTDNAIVKGLRGSPNQRDEALQQLVLNTKLKQYIVGYVKKSGGNEQDGEDIFHDAIIILDRRVREGGFLGESSIENYLQGIARRTWLRKRSKWIEKTEELGPSNHKEELDQSKEEEIISEEKSNAIEEILNHIGSKCKEILKLYKLEYTMEDIAEAVGFATAKVAKNEAYKCRKKFRAFVQSSERYMELLGLSS